MTSDFRQSEVTLTPTLSRTAGRGSQWRFATYKSCALVSFCLSLSATGLCYFAAGPTLGLFFGTFFFVALIVPPLQQSSDSPGGILIGVCAGAAIVWLAAATRPDVYLVDCLKSLLVLAAWALAVLGVGRLLRTARMGPTLAAGLTLLAALAWLSWPVWLTPAIETSHGQAIVDLLVPAHPLFAINGVMRHFGAWDHYPALAYPTLTVLNQDVSYRQPTSVLPALLLHAIFGLALLLRNGSPDFRRAGFIPPGRADDDAPRSEKETAE